MINTGGYSGYLLQCWYAVQSCTPKWPDEARRSSASRNTGRSHLDLPHPCPKSPKKLSFHVVFTSFERSTAPPASLTRLVSKIWAPKRHVKLSRAAEARPPTRRQYMVASEAWHGRGGDVYALCDIYLALGTIENQ